MSNVKLQPIVKNDIFYYRQRLKNRIFAEVVQRYAQLAEQGLTKKEIAIRLGKEPAQITRWFSNASNWTLETISDLLLAMGCELDHRVVELEEVPARPSTYCPFREETYFNGRLSGQGTGTTTTNSLNWVSK